MPQKNHSVSCHHDAFHRGFARGPVHWWSHSARGAAVANRAHPVRLEFAQVLGLARAGRAQDRCTERSRVEARSALCEFGLQWLSGGIGLFGLRARIGQFGVQCRKLLKLQLGIVFELDQTGLCARELREIRAERGFGCPRSALLFPRIADDSL